MGRSSDKITSEIVAYNYTQTLDHFNYKPESYATFNQNYFINFEYWGGANTSSPIFVYTGEEAPVTSDILLAGFINDLASHFRGLVMYMEHRYYGGSMPFGSTDEAYRNSSTLGFFSSTQALADYAQLIIDVKKNLSAENCPVIAVGGSYGGMLASWLRLKYPHVVIGALASSAPILYFDDITPQDAYAVVISKDFRETSENCYNTIKQSWSEIDRVSAQANGIQNLSNIFNTCRPLNSSEELKDYLRAVYTFSAQYDNPPDNLVSKCTDIFDLKPDNKSGWTWQRCTEMVMPIGNGKNDTMFQASPFDMDDYTKTCQEPFWVLEDISATVVAVYTNEGAHFLDLLTATSSDPDWLIAQREKEIKIIELWIAEYNAKLIKRLATRLIYKYPWDQKNV
ncbi:hypothetical protein Patl1_30541 [Pistacia atlantica]|uniref:Uncharacterized protein n=1 Tax=Pistacia atlantica TaxID=434234 RepID=A0ACC1ABM0_9ROSI|nr:hypothetical protein Patl1_30541 [Pistacia atlantica]